MKNRKPIISDRDITSIMGSLLRAGVVIAATVVFAGGMIYLYRHGSDYPHYDTFISVPANLIELKYIFDGVVLFHGRAIIQLGLLILIATPIARVVFSIIGFWLERDYLYVLISIIVLSIIGISMFSGIGG